MRSIPSSGEAWGTSGEAEWGLRRAAPGCAGLRHAWRVLVAHSRRRAGLYRTPCPSKAPARPARHPSPRLRSYKVTTPGGAYVASATQGTADLTFKMKMAWAGFEPAAP